MEKDLIGYLIAGGLISMGLVIHFLRKRKSNDSGTPYRCSENE